jgi:formate dehydrogenase major subunit
MGTLFADSIAPGAFKFAPVPRPATAAKASSEFPFTVVFGNSLYYWHRNSLVSRSETLKREHRILLLDYPEGFVEINTGDAKALGIRDGGKVRLCGVHGSAVTAARVTHEVKSGTVLVPFFVRDVQKQLVASRTEDMLESVRLEKIGE